MSNALSLTAIDYLNPESLGFKGLGQHVVRSSRLHP